MAANGWSEGAWGDVGWGGLANVTIALTLPAATASLGSESVSGDAPVTVSGFSAPVYLGQVQSFQAANILAPSFYNQVHIGSVTARIPVDVLVSGVEGEVQSLTGWGANGWGEFVYGGGVFADVGQILPVSLPSLNGSVGNVSIVGTSNLDLVGVAGNTLLESVLVGAGAIVTETSLFGSIGLGDEAVVGTCNLTLTGVTGTTVVGDEHIETDTGAPITGVPGMTISLGDEFVVTDVTPSITGFAATGSVGSVTLTGTSFVTLTGVAASGNISNVILWGRIVPSQNAIWTEEAA